MKHARAILVLLAITATALPAAAHDEHKEKKHHEHHEDGNKHHAMYLDEIADVEKKLVGLAQAIPAGEFAWRPAEGVRSVSESLMHVAAANYFFSMNLGVPLPEGLDPRSLEKNVTSRDAVIAELERSFAYAKKGIAAVKAGQGEEKVEMFGREFTKKRVLMLYVTHGHEHLGQMIAYARSIGVTPPWSA